MRTVPLLALAFCLCGLAGLHTRSAAQPPKGGAPEPLKLYEDFRKLMGEGKFDIASTYLKAFLDANPSDKDFVEIERKYGTTAFSQLRAVPKWSDDPATEKNARAAVDEAVKRAREAADKLLHDPARVAKYIRNLGATYEERVYAEQELRRTGDFAIPFMVDEFRSARQTDPLYAGILGAIRHLEGSTIAGWVAALDGLPAERKADVISAIAARPDVIRLQANAQTDLSPFLWRVLATPDAGRTTRSLAENLLNTLHTGAKAETRVPEAELVAIGRTFYDHTAKFQGQKNNADGTPSTVPIWVWDEKTEKLKKIDDVPVGQAEEYYGLRYARWALERKSTYEPAQGLVLALAAERAMERSNFGSLAKAEPATYKLLADAPSPVLNDLLDRALSQKKTALALAMVQVLGDRADRAAATPPTGPPPAEGKAPRPSLMERALDYPDPQVQYSAADALLRSPVPVPQHLRGKVVDILRRAAGADPLAPDAKGTVLLTDPNRVRRDDLAHLLRGLGYSVEPFGTGRDLLRRIGRASDFDLIFIDHHTADPRLVDLVGQLQADTRTAARPTFVVATPDKPRVPTFDQLLVRLSALIAATENEVVPVPDPFVPDPRDSPEDNAKRKRENQNQRDNVFRRTVSHRQVDQFTRQEVEAGRMARLNRLIDATGVPLTEAQRRLLAMRVELIAYAVLAAEFPITPDSAPDTAAQMERLRRLLSLQPPTDPYGVGTPTLDLLRLIERFEIDLARQPTAQKRFEQLYARVDPAALGLPVETFRDPALEARLGRTLGQYPAVKIIPEPFARSVLATDLAAAQAEPGKGARDPAEKKATQKGAVEWLSRMATGDVPGFEVKAAEPELRAALRADDLAASAVDAVARFGSAEAQQDLVSLAITPGRPLPLRTRAADAAIRHVRVNTPLVPKSLLDPLAEVGEKEPDPALRGKLLTLKGMLAHDSGAFVDELRGFNPPLLPPPAKEPGKDPKDPKDGKDPKDPKDPKAP